MSSGKWQPFCLGLNVLKILRSGGIVLSAWNVSYSDMASFVWPCKLDELMDRENMALTPCLHYQLKCKQARHFSQDALLDGATA